MIYLDNSATTPTLPAAADRARRYMTEEFFNPAAAYSPAVREERAVNTARKTVAGVINASGDEIIFTSGGTESNNMAIFGALKAMRGQGRIIVGATEHPSVYEPFKGIASQYDVMEAPVDSVGAVDIQKLEEMVTSDTRFVSIMQVNNEVGAINDAETIRRTIKKKAPGALLHMDGVQGFLKVPFDARYCDFYSISGHKFHGPKGVGALYARSGVKFAGGQIGGGQEKNLRSGTTNTPGIMGMEAAVRDYLENLSEYRARMRSCKLHLAEMLTSLPDVLLNGPAVEAGAPHILNASFLGVRGEVLLHALEEKEIYVSTGSACSAHKKGKNRILNAMGITGERQEGAIRFSFSPMNTMEEVDRTAEVIASTITMLRRFKRR
ncbi:MAG: cysteine desulfurase family protein [Clostridia bacterium]|nr:cysteine desulfurase family protein [Clostridia bacterium]